MTSMYEREFNSRGLESSGNCVDMEDEGKCSRSGEVHRNCTPKSCHESTEEDSGWEGKEERGDENQ